MDPLVAVAGVAFGAWGLVCDRLASAWPARTDRRLGVRSLAVAAGAAVAAAGITWRSDQPPWVTGIYLAFLAMLVLLTATDLEQRLLPHLVLDPLIIGAVLFVPFNPAVPWQSALAGAAVAVGFLGAMALVIRGGIAHGDLYLIAPIGLLLGLPGVLGAMLAAALLAGVASLVLLAAGLVGLKSYIPFGPFLVAGMVVALIQGPQPL
jgi:leader peptidase (prepilin peptidase) / N-methyltransferase